MAQPGPIEGPKTLKPEASEQLVVAVLARGKGRREKPAELACGSLAGSAARKCDMSSENESDGGADYAAVTWRSYHPGIFKALLASGRSHPVKARSESAPGVQTAAGKQLRPILTNGNGQWIEKPLRYSRRMY